MAIGNNALLERVAMQKRRINVSPKRQITIPLPFYKELGIESEVECFVKDGVLIIKPVQDLSGGTFAVEILKDLVKQGYQGDNLIAKFQETSGKVRTAVESMINEADRIGRKMDDDGSAKMAEIFGPEK
jgi:bifunctional DNA-binding transcriptional regulator/antitoxin component of YhaV-PrlF toxin-antitoxin module